MTLHRAAEPTEAIRLSRPSLLEVMALQDFLSEISLTPCPANPKVCHNISDCRTTPAAMFAQLRWLCIGSSSPSCSHCFLLFDLFSYYSLMHFSFCLLIV